MTPAERELVRLRIRMRKWPIIAVGIWTICALYWVAVMMVLEAAEWNIMTVSGQQLSPLLFISCLMVTVTTIVLTRNLLSMIPRKRLNKEHEGIVNAHTSQSKNSVDDASWDELIRELKAPREAPPASSFEDNPYHR